jgi:hypothetical protein
MHHPCRRQKSGEPDLTDVLVPSDRDIRMALPLNAATASQKIAY